MSRAIITILALVAAFATGTLSANYAIAHWLQIYGQQSGPWEKLSATGQLGADPYTRAFEHLSGQLPIGGAEGQVFTASKDSENNSLEAACDYQLIGDAPVARLFTLQAEGFDNPVSQENKFLPGALHSDQMIFRGAAFSISISSNAQPGNWLWLNGQGPFSLVLTHYDVAGINSDTGNPLNLPRIIKGRCRNA